jgi:protein-tyrosine phosphatase
MGNICRSPTAEGVMRALVAAENVDIEIDSAGTGGWHAGELPDERSRAAAKQRGYHLDHRARQFVAADFDRFDLIVCMDRDNLAHVQRMARGKATPVKLLRDWESGVHPPDVPDPYSGLGDDFEHVLDICERACRGLLEHVRASP